MGTKNQNQTENSEIREEVLAIVRTMAPDSDLKVEFNLPKDATVHFLGQPLWCCNPIMNNGMLAGRPFLGHALVRGRYFFCLPQDVWEQVYNQLGKEEVADDLVELELAAIKICKDCSWNVGLRSGVAFTYPLLRSSPRHAKTKFNTEGPLVADVEREKRNLLEQQIERRLRPLRAVSRGYAGWLVTNRQFLDEHDALFSTWSDMVLRWGVTALGILLPIRGMFLPGADPTADPRWPDYSKAFEEFFSRWRLQGIAAPYLPIPLQPLMAGTLPISVLPQLTRAGGVICLPDTFPVPSRDELRNLLEPVLHGNPKPDHLTEWMEFIAKDNVAKRPIARFGRLLEFQHYYRILHHRHRDALRGNSQTLKRVLAGVLETSEKTIVGDLRFIRQRLGKDWLDRGRSSAIGPF
jgi:hypothetical protein